ncbi:MAG: hypothetical protein WCZ23_00395 [Rhodospirillaceae bacterium]
MTVRVLGLFYTPWPEHMEARVPLSQPHKLFRKAVWLKSNPRDLAYMSNLFRERYPDGHLTQTVDEDDVRAADVVVLLYSDAVGLGWAGIEWQILHARRDVTEVRVLNGRRRDFVLSGNTRRALLWRRMLEWTMLPEIVMTISFLIVTPLLLTIDWVRGRT